MKLAEYFVKYKYRRRRVRLCLNWLIIAIIIWLIVFNAYVYHFKLDDFFNKEQYGGKNPHLNIDEKEIKALNLDFSEDENFQPPPLPPSLLELYNAQAAAPRVQNVLYLDEKSIEFTQKIQRKRFDINCESLIEWDTIEVSKAYKLLNQSIVKTANKTKFTQALNDENFIFNKKMCEVFKTVQGYNNHVVRDTEYTFPLAYTIFANENVEQFERLIRLVYRPHNLYCIHVDKKASKAFVDAIYSIVNCFTNILISSANFPIKDALPYYRVHAELTCMHDLLTKKLDIKWKYMINLANTEFPLRTNYELTRILQLYNGANDIEILGKYPKDLLTHRWNMTRSESNKFLYKKTKIVKKPLEHNYEIVKGIQYGVFSRDFVKYVMYDKKVKSLIEWSKDAHNPHEWFWATIQHNGQFHPPGGFKAPLNGPLRAKSRYMPHNCTADSSQRECIFSIDDLPSIVTRDEFIVGGFSLDHDPLAYQCMEDWLIVKIKSSQTVNIVNYCKLPYVIPYANHTYCSGARIRNLL